MRDGFSEFVALLCLVEIIQPFDSLLRNIMDVSKKLSPSHLNADVLGLGKGKAWLCVTGAYVFGVYISLRISMVIYCRR